MLFLTTHEEMHMIELPSIFGYDKDILSCTSTPIKDLPFVNDDDSAVYDHENISDGTASKFPSTEGISIRIFQYPQGVDHKRAFQSYAIERDSRLAFSSFPLTDRS